MARPALATAMRDGVVVLDGGLATELERRGQDVSSDLWSARVLRDDPAAVLAAHRAYRSAGAQVITTASYQATFEGFAAAGVDRDEAAALLRRSVELARAAIGPHEVAWVAASVGPYGAMLADGQEYTGEYVAPDWPGRAAGGLGVAELRAFHRPRLEVLADAGPDVLACETVPCLAEAEALLAEVDRLGVPAWLSLTTVPGPDGEPLTRRGEPAAEAFAMAADVPAVLAVGVNCVAPQGVAAAIRTAASAVDRAVDRAVDAASGGAKAVVVYPNSGETWDGPSRTWRGRPGFAPDDVTAWAAGGARLVGGCCRIGPEQVAELASALRER